MSFELTQKEGEYLVTLARRAAKTYLTKRQIIQVPVDAPPKLKKQCGVFVTINTVQGKRHQLRGCIGTPYPTAPLGKAVIESAISSASQDPRFSSMSPDELDHVVFEVSVLTPPEPVKVEKPRDYCSEIKVGRDGLIVERTYCKGLLLPQVPVELGWDEETFLCECCVKAGLPPDSWLLNGTKIYKFQAIVFEETAPKGSILRREMSSK
ncbi:MAG TPA: TIGR00296 family protein [Candidatus Bathyarchaeia archaeon]|nr:TIGR00296 family protein [Candidatus Bathyarchaeia archaeon]